jgi:hypothetical protein
MGNFHEIANCVSFMPMLVSMGEPIEEKRKRARFNSLLLRYWKATSVLSNWGSIDL